MNSRVVSSRKLVALVFSLLACANAAISAIRFTPGFELGFH